MTVAELIEKLKEFNQNLPINMDNGKGYFIFEEEGELCINIGRSIDLTVDGWDYNRLPRGVKEINHDSS